MDIALFLRRNQKVFTSTTTFESTDACWIWSEAVHQQQQHWGDCESWDTSHSQGRKRLYKLPLELGKTPGGDLPHIMCACYEQTSILLSLILSQQTPIVRTRSTEATLLALKLQDQVQSLLKQCSEWCCITLPCPVVFVVQEHYLVWVISFHSDRGGRVWQEDPLQHHN